MKLYTPRSGKQPDLIALAAVDEDAYPAVCPVSRRTTWVAMTPAGAYLNVGKRSEICKLLAQVTPYLRVELVTSAGTLCLSPGATDGADNGYPFHARIMSAATPRHRCLQTHCDGLPAGPERVGAHLGGRNVAGLE